MFIVQGWCRMSIEDDKQLLAYCADDRDADNVFSPGCLTALYGMKCTPIIPMHLKAKRTVM